MSSKSKEYAILDLGEDYYRENCAILTSAYTENVAFPIYYPEAAVENVEPHLMVYKHTYLNGSISQFGSILGFCRLNILSPTYMSGYNEDYKLTKDEILFIVNELTCPWSEDGQTRWEYIDDCVHYNYNLDDIEDIHPSFIEMPNYLKLLE